MRKVAGGKRDLFSSLSIVSELFIYQPLISTSASTYSSTSTFTSTSTLAFSTTPANHPFLSNANHITTQSKCLSSRPAITSPRVSSSATSLPLRRLRSSPSAVSLFLSPPARVRIHPSHVVLAASKRLHNDFTLPMC